MGTQCPETCCWPDHILLQCFSQTLYVVLPGVCASADSFVQPVFLVRSYKLSTLSVRPLIVKLKPNILRAFWKSGLLTCRNTYAMIQVVPSFPYLPLTFSRCTCNIGALFSCCTGLCTSTSLILKALAHISLPAFEIHLVQKAEGRF